jgi:hypothetical protein
MNSGIQGYDISVVSVAGVKHVSYSVRLPTKPAGPGSDYLIRYARETSPGSGVFTTAKKISNVPYAERSCITLDSDGKTLVVAYQTKDPQDTGIVSIAYAQSPNLGVTWTR